MARNRFDERRFARVVCPFDRTESDAVLFERIGALRFSDQRRGVVAVFVDHHEALPFDGLDTFGLHIRFIGFVFRFERIHFVRFERCARIAFDAANAFAARQVAAEARGEYFGADYLVVDLDHGNVSIIPAGRPGDWKKRYEFMPQGVWP